MANPIDHSSQHGAVIGAVLAFGQKVYTSIAFIGTITMAEIMDASILAAVGAVVGFTVTSLLKYLKRKFFN